MKSFLLAAGLLLTFAPNVYADQVHSSYPGYPPSDYPHHKLFYDWSFTVDEAGNAEIVGVIQWEWLENHQTWAFLSSGTPTWSGGALPTRVIPYENPSVSYPVTGFSAWLFVPYDVTLVFPGCYKNLHGWGVEGSYFHNLVLQEGIERIGEGFFERCRNLQTIRLPSTLTHLGKRFAFRSYPTRIEMPCRGVEIVSEAFMFPGANCEIVVPSIEAWCSHKFSHNHYAFCITTDEDGNDYSSFLVCNGKMVTDLASAVGVTEIPPYAFERYKRFGTHLTLPPTVTNIAEHAFVEIDHVRHLTIPPSVKRIEPGAFNMIYPLHFVDFLGSRPEMSDGAFRLADTVRPEYFRRVIFYDDTWKGIASDEVSLKTKYLCTNRWDCTFVLGAHARRTGGGELQQVVKFNQALVWPELEVDEDYAFEGWDSPFDGTGSTRTYTAKYVHLPLQRKGPETLTVDGANAEGTRLEARGGTRPYSWVCEAGLPRGLALTSRGELKGTTDFCGTTNLDVCVVDAAGARCRLAYELTVRAAPCFSPSDGDFFTGATCEGTVTSPVAGAEIYVTTDGSEPEQTDACRCTGPVSVSQTTTVRAIVVADGIVVGSGSATWIRAADETFPDLGDDVSEAGLAHALEGVADERLAENVRTASDYAAFRQWALAWSARTGRGLSELQSCPRLWHSFALGQDDLLDHEVREEDLHLSSFSTDSNVSGACVLTLAVDGVKVGESASVENLRKVFGLRAAFACRSDVFSADNVTFELLGVDDGHPTLLAMPVCETPSFFLRVPAAEASRP